MLEKQKLYKRLIWHIFGAILIAFGVQTIVYSNVGSAPLDAITFYLARLGLQIFNNSDYSSLYSLIGVASLIYGTLITLILVLIKRDKKLIFTWLNILLVAGIIFLWGFLFDSLKPLDPNKYFIRIIIGLLGLLPLSIGVFITLISGLPAGPHEELQKYFQTKVNNIFIARLIVEVGYLIIASALMIISIVVIDNGMIHITESQVSWYTIVVSILVSLLIFLYSKIYHKLEKKFHKEDDSYES